MSRPFPRDRLSIRPDAAMLIAPGYSMGWRGAGPGASARSSPRCWDRSRLRTAGARTIGPRATRSPPPFGRLSAKRFEEGEANDKEHLDDRRMRDGAWRGRLSAG